MHALYGQMLQISRTHSMLKIDMSLSFHPQIFVVELVQSFHPLLQVEVDHLITRETSAILPSFHAWVETEHDPSVYWNQFILGTTIFHWTIWGGRKSNEYATNSTHLWGKHVQTLRDWEDLNLYRDVSRGIISPLCK